MIYFLISILIIQLAIIVFLIIKNRNYDKAINLVVEERDELVSFLEAINNRLFNDMQALKNIDARGSFESDDEVGFIFKSIFNLVNDTFNFIQNIVNDEENEKEEITK